MRNNQLLALVGMLAMAVVLVGAGLGLHAVLAVPVTEDKPVQPAPEQPKAVEFTGKLNIWRTIGPDGRALTTINATGGQPDQDTIVLSFGKKGEQAADKLAEEAAALYRKSPKIDVIVTGVPDVRPNESGGLTKIVRVRTIKAKP